MKRVTGLVIGGIAVASLTLTGCNSSSSDSAGTAPEATTEASGDFCQEAEGMQTRYLEKLQQVAAEGKTEDEAALKELNDQLVADVKQLQSALPGDAPEEVQSAFSNVVANLESGDQNAQNSQADDATLSAYMTEQCPELAEQAAPAQEAPADEPAPEAS